jgi:phospholipase C
MKNNGSDAQDKSSQLISRRQFLIQSAATAMALGLGGKKLLARGQDEILPAADASALQHIILVMMENRSFDHLLGWLPGANGKQKGLEFTDKKGKTFSTHKLAPDYQGCGFNDPEHGYIAGREEYNNGACDGWLRAGTNDIYSIGYYTKHDLPFLAPAAQAWTVCDNYFAAIMTSTFANRFYQHAAQTDRISNLDFTSTLPTIWDRLAEQGVPGRYYYSDLAFLDKWGDKYQSITFGIDQFFRDCASGNLANVCYVDPQFEDNKSGNANDDHPHADIRNGEAFLNSIYRAVTKSPAWPSTALIINFDEWGGFFDHVPPPAGPIPEADMMAGNTDGRLGFRVPCLIISPFARRGYIAHNSYDHTSILKLIESRFNLAPLTVRDQVANNIGEILDFDNPNLQAPQFHVPTGPFKEKCKAGSD